MATDQIAAAGAGINDARPWAKSELRTALHECCHFAVLASQSVWVPRVELFDAGPLAGRVVREAYRGDENTLPGFLAGLVAGGVGELMYTQRPLDEWFSLPGIGSDAQFVRRYIDCYPFASELFQSALATAHAVLTEHWQSVLLLATALVAKRALTFEEIHNLWKSKSSATSEPVTAKLARLMLPQS